MPQKRRKEKGNELEKENNPGNLGRSPRRKKAESPEKKAGVLGVGVEEISGDKIIADVKAYLCDIAEVEINDIVDIIDLIG